MEAPEVVSVEKMKRLYTQLLTMENLGDSPLPAPSAEVKVDMVEVGATVAVVLEAADMGVAPGLVVEQEVVVEMQELDTVVVEAVDLVVLEVQTAKE